MDTKSFVNKNGSILLKFDSVKSFSLTVLDPDLLLLILDFGFLDLDAKFQIRDAL